MAEEVKVETHSDKLSEFKDLVDSVFKTKSGAKLLNFLKDTYCTSSSIQSTPELTYYSLGQKELIEMLEQTYQDDKYKERISVDDQFNEDF